MTLLQYTHLKQQVIYRVGISENPDHLLSQLKEYYKDDIDSNRRLDQINTIGQLIRILEIRDILSEDDVSPLKEIARRLQDNELLKSISDYQLSHVPRGNVNYYAVGINSKQPQRETADSLPAGHPYGNISARKKAQINATIVEEIGTHWRDLARNLKMQERRIDEIDKEKNNLEEKAIEILKLYEQKADPQRGFYILCYALEKTRRKDLSRKIQEVMVMNM